MAEKIEPNNPFDTSPPTISVIMSTDNDENLPCGVPPHAQASWRSKYEYMDRLWIQQRAEIATLQAELQRLGAEKAKAEAAVLAEKAKAEEAKVEEAEKVKAGRSGIPAQQNRKSPVCSLMLARILLTLLVAMVAIVVAVWQMTAVDLWQMTAVDVGRPPMLLLS